MDRYTMFGTGRDRPLTAKLDRAHEAPSAFAQTVPAEFSPAPEIERPDVVGHLLDSPPPPSAKAAIGTFLVAARQERKDELQRQIAELTPQCRASLDRLRTRESKRENGAFDRGEYLEADEDP